ncbi:hypothetical protein [Ruminococcus sp.]|uniref:hypothetical protein n=1 Tax=Ruminococcus sp. TaxID=41978 RepID=UPI002589A2ED|nr:hypothetical protein [Ruminococcus sp.]MCR5020309.1 hypothetical protein [Ruminococcus sp.]
MGRSEIVKYKDNLLNNLRLRREYDEAAGLRNKVLLVEGVTDQRFIEHIKEKDIRCLSVAEFMRARSAFNTSRSPEPELYNSKDVIITILKHIAFFPEYSDFPKGAEKWPLYGLVDNDFDDSNVYARVTKLFFTDTHDLETLMISTDNELFTRLEQCSITEDEVKAALYIAIQLAAFRQAIRNNGNLSPGLINEADGTIAFEVFTDGNTIDLIKLLQYINSKLEKPLLREKLKKTSESIIKDLKKKLDKDGCWKKSIESFTVTPESDFWMDVNGHDILSAICYLKPSVREVFKNQGSYSQNRDFELALSEAYDYDCLKKTKLYAKLQTAELLRE